MREEHYAKVDEYRERFASAQPFPHLVIDDFLEPSLAEAVLQEFPATNVMPKSRDYMFGNKHELSSVATQGDACATLVAQMLDPRFAKFLSDISGFQLFVDPAFHGGGFHQGGDGSFLDMHVDFNVHPLHEDWLRRLNVLVYLNPDWKWDYDGRLIIRSSEGGPTSEIEPLYNRAVIMYTGENTHHGYRRMSLPEGVTRRSVATYAYELMDPGSVRARTTGWFADDAGPFKKAAARLYQPAVRLKNRVLGSSTAKNR